MNIKNIIWSLPSWIKKLIPSRVLEKCAPIVKHHGDIITTEELDKILKKGL
jgi:hypothetical protein